MKFSASCSRLAREGSLTPIIILIQPVAGGTKFCENEHLSVIFFYTSKNCPFKSNIQLVHNLAIFFIKLSKFKSFKGCLMYVERNIQSEVSDELLCVIPLVWSLTFTAVTPTQLTGIKFIEINATVPV